MGIKSKLYNKAVLMIEMSGSEKQTNHKTYMTYTIHKWCGEHVEGHGVSIHILVGSSYKTCQIHLWYRCGESCVPMMHTGAVPAQNM